jgi:hypothetical protein
METLSLVVSVYLLFGVPLVVGGFLVWIFVRKRIHLRAADWLLLLLPFAIWLSATVIYDGNKSLSNLVEVIFVGCAALLLFAARSLATIARPHQEARWASFALLGSCLTALALWALVPGLPE